MPPSTPPPPPLHLDHVQIAAPVGGEPEARRFYGALLGLEEIPKPPELAVRGGAWFRVGALQLHVGMEADFRPARKAHVALRVAGREALDALYERLARAGAPVRRDASVPGTHRFYADDPFGNRVEFLAD